MRSARTRLTRAHILAIGNVKFSEGEPGSTGGSGDPNPSNPAGGTGQGGKSGDPKDGTGGTGAPKDDLDDITDPEVLKRKLRNAREAEQRLHGKMTAAERERDELKTKQTEAEEAARRESQSEVENLKDDIRKRDETIQARNATIQSLTVQLAFAQVKDVDWHDPEDALRLVDLSGVEFDEKTGEVKDKSKVVKAAKDLAKAKPHLVKSSTAVPGSVPNGVRNGQPPAGGPPTNSDREKELRTKYKIRS